MRSFLFLEVMLKRVPGIFFFVVVAMFKNVKRFETTNQQFKHITTYMLHSKPIFSNSSAKAKITKTFCIVEYLHLYYNVLKYPEKQKRTL